MHGKRGTFSKRRLKQCVVKDMWAHEVKFVISEWAFCIWSAEDLWYLHFFMRFYIYAYKNGIYGIFTSFLCLHFEPNLEEWFLMTLGPCCFSFIPKYLSVWLLTLLLSFQARGLDFLPSPFFFCLPNLFLSMRMLCFLFPQAALLAEYIRRLSFTDILQVINVEVFFFFFLTVHCCLFSYTQIK